MIKINVVEALVVIRDNLRTNIEDPIYTAGGQNRGGAYWIFADEPILSSFPQIQVIKIDNPSEVLDIGSDYTSYEQLFFNVYFKSKNGFKVTISGTEYKNSQLVEYYLGLIKTTLKGQFSTLFDAGCQGYKCTGTTNIEYDSATQLYFGAVSCRICWFTTNT